MIQKRTQVENLTSGFLSTPVFLVSLFTFTPNLKPGWFTLSAQTSGYCYINWFKDFAINTSINTFKKTSINIPINISINTFYFELDDFYYCSILALYIFFCKLKLIYKQPKPKKGTLIFNFFLWHYHQGSIPPMSGSEPGSWTPCPAGFPSKPKKKKK